VDNLEEKVLIICSVIRKKKGGLNTCVSVFAVNE
jgi:hypothetical protein